MGARRLVYWLGLSFVVLSLGRGASATPVIRLLYVDPPGSSIDAGARSFKQEVETLSKGTLRVETQAAGQDELSILERVRAGQTEMCIVTTAPLSNYDKPLEMLDTPFLFADYAHVDRTLDGALGQSLLSGLTKKGLRGLVYMDSGFRIITSNHPLSHYSDFKNLRVRVMQNEIYSNFVKLIGAVPVPSAVTKINEMAAKGYIDAADRSYPTYWEFHLNDVQKFVLESNHAYAAEAMLVNEQFYETLPATDRHILEAAARHARDTQRKRFRDDCRDVKNACLKTGIAIRYLSPQDRNSMRAACTPIYERLQAQFGDLMHQLVTESEQ